MFNPHIVSQLSSYLDGQLSEKEKARVQKHLQVCQSCAQELARLKLISEKVKTWQAPDLGKEFDGSVTDRIVRWELDKRSVPMEKRTLKELIPSTALVGILALVFVLVSMQVFVRRQVSGRLREASNDIGAPADILETRLFEPSGGRTGMLKMSEGFSGEKNQKEQKYDGIVRADSVVSKSEFGSIEEGEAGTVIIIQPTLPATEKSEMVIRTAEIRLEVGDGRAAYQKASQLCQELGGYLSDSKFYKDNEGRESGSITLRIPKDKFTLALDKLSSLGKVGNITTKSQDVRQEYANLKSRLDTSMVVYEKMLEALRNRKITIPEAMRTESELTPVLKRIEDLKNQIEYLNNAVSFTTITLNFHEPLVSAKALKETKRIVQEKALATAINTIKFLAAAIPVAVLLGFWVIVAIIVTLTIKHVITKISKRD